MTTAAKSSPAQPTNPQSDLAPPSITTPPASQTVAVGQTASFSVAASGSAPLTYQWLENGAAISGATSAAFTTSPAAISDSGTQFTVTVSNPGGAVTSNAATLTVNATTVAITVNPNNASVAVGNSQQLVGDVTGTSNTAITWTVSGAGCTGAACGTISGSGLYVAPASVPSPATVTVKATSVADATKSASASLTIAAVSSISLSVSPVSADIPTGGTQLFAASITGASNTAVTWSLTGAGCSGSACGTLSISALSAIYSAPAVAPAPATVSVVATSTADPTKSASANVTIVPTVAVTVTPANVSVAAGSTQQFTASVTGTSNTTVDWAVSGTGCSGTACGTIASSGVYTAPAVQPTASVTVTATSAADSTKSGSAVVTVVANVGNSYYLAPAADGGSDSNNGTSSATPWLSPNHAVDCGDVITAAASASYAAVNFGSGDWGTVTCSAGNNVAWLKCAVFDACKISSSSQDGMKVSASYWGVEGWEATTTGSGQGCFTAEPPTTSASIHHIIFANDVANGCQNNGINSYSNGNAGVDYIVFVGDIAYNAAQGSGNCFSGLSIYQPVETDSLPGTHIFLAGNFSYGNVDGPCASGTPTDGEGIILDTFDGSQGGLPSPYAGQTVAENNILVSNGGRGLEVFNNQAGSSHAPIYLLHNTMWGNNGDTHQSGTYCGELLISSALETQAAYNVAATNATDGCGSNPIYAYYVGNSGASDVVNDGVGFSAAGTYGGINNSSGFSYGLTNLFGTNPGFSSATAPGAPSCGSATSVPNCMATVIANFTPTTVAATAYGYQIPSTSPVSDPLFPQWLCNVNLPAGLVTLGCP